MSKNIYLVPTLLAENTHSAALPPDLIEKATELKVFFVENIKTARRFLSSLTMGIVIDDLTFYELTKDSQFEEVFDYMMHLESDAGILSEAGCPGVADPGALAVEIAHQLEYKVIPMVGPSSILLALMASGFSGQSFAFHGYLPIDKKERQKRIKELERISLSTGQTQLFMETPYRNLQMLESILETCGNQTLLSISANITAPDAFSKTYSISKWKSISRPDIHKKPAIFSFGK